jgi:hypothetical protein
VDFADLPGRGGGLLGGDPLEQAGGGEPAVLGPPRSGLADPGVGEEGAGDGDGGVDLGDGGGHGVGVDQPGVLLPVAVETNRIDARNHRRPRTFTRLAGRRATAIPLDVQR